MNYIEFNPETDTELEEFCRFAIEDILPDFDTLVYKFFDLDEEKDDAFWQAVWPSDIMVYRKDEYNYVDGEEGDHGVYYYYLVKEGWDRSQEKKRWYTAELLATRELIAGDGGTAWQTTLAGSLIIQFVIRDALLAFADIFDKPNPYL